MDEQALIREYVERHSEDAFAELVSRRVNFVYSAALRQAGNPDLAKDITQVVFILLARKAKQLPAGTLSSGWLFRTTRFVTLAQMRTEAKRRQREILAQMHSEQEPKTLDLRWEGCNSRFPR